MGLEAIIGNGVGGHHREWGWRLSSLGGWRPSSPMGLEAIIASRLEAIIANGVGGHHGHNGVGGYHR